MPELVFGLWMLLGMLMGIPAGICIGLRIQKRRAE